ncbi:hypothetical protein B6U79_03185 [Candidatus Bathyarchaeota archaeon ex4484_231]|nr:MAG: hypothetical protein B6U79_03185 [Candidatus Bathyarchaeota archaeon ex4484_231]
MFTYEDIFAVFLLVTAFLALHLKNVTHAVISFGAMFTALSVLYFSLGAPFAAIFQLVVAAGTIAVFFLAGEMLTPKNEKPQGFRSKALAVLVAVAFSVPSIVLNLETGTSTFAHDLTFRSALWEFRALDIAAQGVVILTLALGVAMVLKERKKEER